MLHLLGGAVLVLVFAGVVCRIVPCLACLVVLRVSASVQFPEVRVAWLVLWCRGVSSGAAGWAWRNTPGPPIGAGGILGPGR